MPIGVDAAADGVAGCYALMSFVHFDALVSAYTLIDCEIIELFGVVVVVAAMVVAPPVAAVVAMDGMEEVGCDHVSSAEIMIKLSIKTRSNVRVKKIT